MKHKKKKKGINPSAMRCQYCGGTVVLRSADGIYHENHSHTIKNQEFIIWHQAA